ncbi:hypothetical protein Tco_1213982 [Tanacetum coccineum]
MDFAIYAPRAFMEFVKNASKRITFLYDVPLAQAIVFGVHILILVVIIFLLSQKSYKYPAVKEPMEVVHWLIFTKEDLPNVASEEESMVQFGPWGTRCHGLDRIGFGLGPNEGSSHGGEESTHAEKATYRLPAVYDDFRKEFKEAQSNNKITTSVNSFANCSSTHTVAFASCSLTHTVAMAITCTVGSKTKAADLSSDDHNYEQTEPATYDNAQLLGVLATLHGGHGGYNQILPVQVPVAMPIAAETQPVVVQVCESTFIPSRLQLMYTPGEFPLSFDSLQNSTEWLQTFLARLITTIMKSVAIAKMDSSASTTTHTGTRMHSVCDGSASVAVPVDHTGISEKVVKNVVLSYLGGMWVLFEFDSLTTKEKFLNHSGIGSWFTKLIQATSSFENDERIVWISIEGLPIKAWTPNTFCKIASLWELDAWFPNFQEDDQDDLSSDGESQEGDVANKADNNESDVDRVSESSFMHENDTAHKDANICKKGEVGSHSEDPFNIYGILDGQKNNVCNSCSDEPKFPPGFTPDNIDHEKNVAENIKDTTERVQSLSNKLNDRCSNRGFSSQRSMNSHSQKSKELYNRCQVQDFGVVICYFMEGKVKRGLQGLRLIFTKAQFDGALVFSSSNVVAAAAFYDLHCSILSAALPCIIWPEGEVALEGMQEVGAWEQEN